MVLLPLAVHRTVFHGRIHPGVSVAGIDVGGLRASEALDRLAQGGLAPNAPLTVRADAVSWSLEPAASGVQLDVRETVARAYAVGRMGALAPLTAPFRRWFGHDVPAHVTIDRDLARQAVESLAEGFDRPASDAGLRISGTIVTTVPAVEGRALNVDGAVAVLATAAASGGWPIGDLVLPYNTIAPSIPDAGPAVAAAEALLTAPITLRRGSEEWVLAPEEMGRLLRAVPGRGTVALGLDPDRWTAWLDPVTKVISRTAELPRFHFDEATSELVLVRPGEPQRRVSTARTADRVLAVADGRSRAVLVAVDEVPPAVGSWARAADLGIVELIWEETSRFRGSPVERMHNIELATARFDGLLIPPDSLFSFNEHVGDISPEAGYEETLIIMDGTTTDGVGGGVCQVSTTLFRTALRSGLPIEERSAHGYRVAYYEQGEQPGLDATVYAPQVDLKFRNDTGHWILIETETDLRAATTTFRFYGTRVDREVTILPAVISNPVPAPPAQVVLDPSLAPGETEILEHARAGASVRVTRSIKQGDEETREEFHSHYQPTGEVTAVGPSGAPVDLLGQLEAGAGIPAAGVDPSALVPASAP